VADCCILSLKMSAGTRLFLLEREKMGKIGSFSGKIGKIWSSSVKNGRFWPVDVPRESTSPENCFSRRVPRKRAHRAEQHGHTLLFLLHFGPPRSFHV
jgi:hypothetical protein